MYFQFISLINIEVMRVAEILEDCDTFMLHIW